MSIDSDRRQTQRRQADRPARQTLPVPSAARPEPKSGETVTPQGAYSAQLLGQDGEKRGLRGGSKVLEAAKSAYLGAEFSGPADRRPPTGVLKRKDL